MDTRGYYYDNLDAEPPEFPADQMRGELLVMPGPLCIYWHYEEGPLCGHSSCYTIAADAEELPDLEGDRYPEHDCPIQVFLDDPITQAYGLGGDMDEWGKIIRCEICEGFADT